MCLKFNRSNMLMHKILINQGIILTGLKLNCIFLYKREENSKYLKTKTKTTVKVTKHPRKNIKSITPKNNLHYQVSKKPNRCQSGNQLSAMMMQLLHLNNWNNPWWINYKILLHNFAEM